MTVRAPVYRQSLWTRPTGAEPGADLRGVAKEPAFMTADSFRRPLARLGRQLAAAAFVALACDPAAATLPPGNTVQHGHGRDWFI